MRKLNMPRRLSSSAARTHGGNMLFMLPTIILFCIVVLIPFFQGIPYSFTNWKSIVSETKEFNGLKNYIYLIKNKYFQDSLLVTFKFTILYMISANVMGLLLALAICTAADALLFTAIRGMAQRSELKARNDLLARQIDRQNEHYAALTAQYENLRRIRHDISSHLYTMQLLLQEGQYDEAAAYSAEVTEACRFRSDLGACENPVVDAFLYSRTEELRAQGYALQLQVCIPAETGIRNADMVVAFGNLLDNAAEACRDAGEKRLSLSARMDRGFLCIEVRNPAPAAPARHSRRIPELERGIGSHILRALAETYEGSYALTPSGGECTASLLLKGAAA